MRGRRWQRRRKWESSRGDKDWKRKRRCEFVVVVDDMAVVVVDVDEVRDVVVGPREYWNKARVPDRVACVAVPP